MSEYQESHSVSRLIGSPPGYVGFGDEPYLVRELRLHPYSVVLLDEIEKAHPNVLTIFLQVFDEGRLTDARGRRIHCGDAIFILTSNIGAEVEIKPPIGFQRKGEAVTGLEERWREKIMQAIVGRLSPELVNRLQAIVLFKPLEQETLYAILDLYVERVNRQLSERGIIVELDASAKDFLLLQGYSPQFGARHLYRAFEHWITEPLSRQILSTNLKPGSIARFSYQDGQMSLQFVTAGSVKTITYQEPE